MLIIAISDLHLGKGKFLRNGQLNILEDFFEDDRFVEFLEFYSSGKHYWSDIHLILNGDIFNLIQIDIQGVFTHIIDEDVSTTGLELIYHGHRQFFEGLKNFLASPNKKITYVIGNHDSGMAFEKTKEKFREYVGEKVEFCFEMNIHGIHIEHGHRFEVINAVPEHKFFLEGPNGKKILNLPWGSLFCIHILPILKKERPYIDKVHPMSAYVKWCLINDFLFFLRMSVVVLKYFIETNFDAYTRMNRNFKTTMKILKQITIYPKYEKKAKSILKKGPTLHTVVMGHTHVVEWRRFPEGKYYFNSGTWNSLPSMDAGMHQSVTHLTYIKLDINPKTKELRGSALNTWQGKWRPFREEISNTNF